VQIRNDDLFYLNPIHCPTNNTINSYKDHPIQMDNTNRKQEVRMKATINQKSENMDLDLKQMSVNLIKTNQE